MLAKCRLENSEQKWPNLRIVYYIKEKRTPWPESASEPTERPPLVGEVTTNFCEERWCHVASAADPLRP
jgi:hypothetical protein